MSSFFTIKEKTGFVSFGLLFAAIIALTIFIENHIRYQKIFNEKIIVYGKIIKEERDYIGGQNSKTYKYTLEYSYDGEKYHNDASHMYGRGHFKIGEKIEIFIQKSNPYNFIIAENANYWGSLFISILFFIATFLSFKYRGKLIDYFS